MQAKAKMIDTRKRGQRRATRPRLAIRDIMSTGVLSLEPETTLREAAELFSRHQITGAPVIADGKVIGVVSTNDIITFNATQPVVPDTDEEQIAWGDWAPAEAPTVRDEPPTSASYFTDLWLDGGAELVERFNEVSGPAWDILDEHTVDEVMTLRMATLTPGTSVKRAARYMIDLGVHRVLVVERGRLAGVVTTMDIVRAVADNRV